MFALALSITGLPDTTLSVSAPSFVGSIDHGDFVYFFFRETAVEYINCGKVNTGSLADRTLFLLGAASSSVWPVLRILFKPCMYPQLDDLLDNRVAPPTSPVRRSRSENRLKTRPPNPACRLLPDVTTPARRECVCVCISMHMPRSVNSSWKRRLPGARGTVAVRSADGSILSQRTAG